MLMLSNPNAMILMTDFEKAGGGGEGGGDQKRFLELPKAEARQLKIQILVFDCNFERQIYLKVKKFPKILKSCEFGDQNFVTISKFALLQITTFITLQFSSNSCSCMTKWH